MPTVTLTVIVPVQHANSYCNRGNMPTAIATVQHTNSYCNLVTLCSYLHNVTKWSQADSCSKYYSNVAGKFGQDHTATDLFCPTFVAPKPNKASNLSCSSSGSEILALYGQSLLSSWSVLDRFSSISFGPLEKGRKHEERVEQNFGLQRMNEKVGNICKKTVLVRSILKKLEP